MKKYGKLQKNHKKCRKIGINRQCVYHMKINYILVKIMLFNSLRKRMREYFSHFVLFKT